VYVGNLLPPSGGRLKVGRWSQDPWSGTAAWCCSSLSQNSCRRTREESPYIPESPASGEVEGNPGNGSEEKKWKWQPSGMVAGRHVECGWQMQWWAVLVGHSHWLGWSNGEFFLPLNVSVPEVVEFVWGRGRHKGRQAGRSLPREKVGMQGGQARREGRFEWAGRRKLWVE